MGSQRVGHDWATDLVWSDSFPWLVTLLDSVIFWRPTFSIIYSMGCQSYRVLIDAMQKQKQNNNDKKKQQTKQQKTHREWMLSLFGLTHPWHQMTHQIPWIVPFKYFLNPAISFHGCSLCPCINYHLASDYCNDLQRCFLAHSLVSFLSIVHSDQCFTFPCLKSLIWSHSSKDDI